MLMPSLKTMQRFWGKDVHKNNNSKRVARIHPNAARFKYRGVEKTAWLSNPDECRLNS
jgi:hypothetical protein